MNRVLQQWLLNLAIDFPVHFGLLPSLLDGNDREPQSLNVKALRGFELDEGVARLMELAESGLSNFSTNLDWAKPVRFRRPRCLCSGDTLEPKKSFLFN